MNVREATIAYKRTPNVKAEPIRSSRDVEKIIRAVLPDAPQERFVCLALDVKNRAVSWCTISTGTESMCIVDPADVFRFVLLAGSHACIVAHNHPSGEPTPSAEDVALTTRLAQGASILGLRIVDHVILGDGGSYFSFLDAGLLGR